MHRRYKLTENHPSRTETSVYYSMQPIVDKIKSNDENVSYVISIYEQRSALRTPTTEENEEVDALRREGYSIMIRCPRKK